MAPHRFPIPVGRRLATGVPPARDWWATRYGQAATEPDVTPWQSSSFCIRPTSTLSNVRYSAELASALRHPRCDIGAHRELLQWPPEPFVLAREKRRAYARRMSGEPAERRSAAVTARRLVETLGGRYSAQLGIAVDEGPDEVERWFLAATLFGHRISAEVAMRTYRAIERAGIRTIAGVAGATWDELVALLDEGGYVRYDFSTASRLLALAGTVIERHHGRISSVAEATDDPAEIEATLDRLPGWGPTTVRLFLRELRGVWPGARPPCDKRARWAAEHLGLGQPEGDARGLAWLEALAALAGVDPRDLESTLVRLALAHGRRRTPCPGGDRCLVWLGRWPGSAPRTRC